MAWLLKVHHTPGQVLLSRKVEQHQSDYIVKLKKKKEKDKLGWQGGKGRNGGSKRNWKKSGEYDQNTLDEILKDLISTAIY